MYKCRCLMPLGNRWQWKIPISIRQKATCCSLTLWFLVEHKSNSSYIDRWNCNHDDVIKWRHFPSYWPFARGIHRSPVNSPHKGQGRGALMFTLIYAWTNSWVNNRDTDDLKRHPGHYDVTVMKSDKNPEYISWVAQYICNGYQNLSTSVFDRLY